MTKTPIPRLLLLMAAFLLLGISPGRAQTGDEATQTQATPDQETPDQAAPDQATPGQATRDLGTQDLATPSTPGVPQKADRLFHRHGGGGDDGEDRPLALRRNWAPDPQADRQDVLADRRKAPGLALDRADLPGELGPTPEAGRRLFDKPDAGLALRPDPWVVPDR